MIEYEIRHICNVFYPTLLYLNSCFEIVVLKLYVHLQLSFKKKKIDMQKYIIYVIKQIQLKKVDY